MDQIPKYIPRTELDAYRSYRSVDVSIYWHGRKQGRRVHSIVSQWPTFGSRKAKDKTIDIDIMLL